MRSTISRSNSAALFHAKILCVICAILIILLEVLSGYLLKHYSGTYLRVFQQQVEAVGSRPSNPGEPVSVLMVGNSLLLAGVDVDRLHQLTATRLRIYPIFLEATTYYDWLYGLRHLFREGARRKADSSDPAHSSVRQLCPSNGHSFKKGWSGDVSTCGSRRALHKILPVR